VSAGAWLAVTLLIGFAVVGCAAVPVEPTGTVATSSLPGVSPTPAPAEPTDAAGTVVAFKEPYPLVMTIVDPGSALVDARMASRGELALADGDRGAAALLSLDDQSLLLWWIASICDEAGRIEIGRQLESISLTFTPRPACELLGIPRGVVMRFSRSVDPATIALVAPRTDVIGEPTPSPVAATPDLATIPWYGFDHVIEGMGTEGPTGPYGETLTHLRMGFLDGTVTYDRERAFDPPAGSSATSLRGRLFPFASGINAGRVVFGVHDDVGSRLWVFEVATGRPELVYETREIVYRAAVSNDGSTIYVWLLDRRSMDDAGVWRLPADGGREPTKILDPVPDWSLGGEHDSWHGELAITPDGTLLVVVDCPQPGSVGSECYVRVVDLANDAVVLERTGLEGEETHASITGLTDRVMSIGPSVVELRTGRSQRFDGCGWNQTVVQSGGVDYVVTVSDHPIATTGCPEDRYAVSATRLPDGTPTPLWEEEFSERTFDFHALPERGAGHDVQLPDGYVLLTWNGGIGDVDVPEPVLLPLPSP
jgi:hypothetical protein